MTFKIKSFNFLFVLAIAVWFTSCSRDDDGLTKKFDVPTDLTISDSGFFPEDIVVNHNRAYVSGFGDGTIRVFDLTDETPTAVNFASAEEGYLQRWGLTSYKEVLLSIVN